MKLTPPILPPFLAGAFDLKPVEGVPSDEEVKAVHAVIRALNDVANVSALYDADLAMRLSMHLFSIQMARYRDIYPCIIFPSNTTHTPPQLPAHIPIKLEPVAGPPSDEQIKSVQTSLRLYESMANIPSMFDADLNMKLSQHLFNIQFERYLRQVADADHSAPVATSRAEEMNPDRPEDSVGSDIEDGTVEEPPHRFALQPSSVAQATVEQLEHVRSEPPQNPTELLKIGLEDTNQLLVKIGGTLENVNRVLIRTQQSTARGLNRTFHHHQQSGCDFTHGLLNAKGEDPQHLGLPSLLNLQYNLVGNHQVEDSDIVQYLRFYGLGEELIEEGDAPTIKEGKRDAAKAELKSYFGF